MLPDEQHFETLVKLIHSYNRMWKHIQERETQPGISETAQAFAELVKKSHSILQHRKDMTQLRLLRAFPSKCFLYEDAASPGMYSIALRGERQVKLSSGVFVNDACHVPIHKIDAWLPTNELKALKERGNGFI